VSIKLQSHVYRVQFFTLLGIVSIVVFQYELLMLDRGVSLALALGIFSVSQVLNLLTIIFLSRSNFQIKTQNKVLQLSLVLRTVTIGAMFLTQSSLLFIGLFLVYQILSSINIMFEGMIAQWSFEKDASFSRIRFWGSVGFACAGFVATLIFDITGVLNNLLLLVFIVNLFNTIIAFRVPIDFSQQKPEKQDAPTKIPLKYKGLLVFGGAIMSFPNSFSVILNNHYREIFHLGIEQAIFFVSLSVLLGSFVSEFFAFFSVDKLIRKYKPVNIIFVGIVLSVMRWLIAFVAWDPILLALSFLFHGFSFVFVYIGCVSLIKEKIGNQFTSKLIMEFVIISNGLGFVMIQLTNVIINFFTSMFLVGLYSILSVVIGIVFIYFAKRYLAKA